MKIQGAFAHLRIRDNGGTGGAFGYLGTLRNTAIPAPTVFAPMNNQGAFPHLRTRDNGGTGGAFGYLAEQDNVAEESALNELPADNYGIHSTPAVSVTSGHIADGMIDARHIAANSTTNVGFTEDSAPKVGLFHKLFKTPMEKVVGGLILITILLMMQSRMKPCVTTRRIVQHPRNYKLIPEFNPDELGSGKHILHQIAVHPIE